MTIFLAIMLPLAGVLFVEALRWALRPEARRLRTIKKIGGRR